MLETLGDLVALNREAFITAIGQLLDDTALVKLDYLYRLFAVVD